MMYSRAFDLCQICPEDTYSRSGDITCTQCAPRHYSPQRSAACFPDARVGGIIRLDAEYSTFAVADWQREVAIMLDTEPRYIDVILTRPGSVIIYFDILDPQNLSTEDSSIRKLSGNEKMLLFYQWWLTNDDRMKTMSTSVIDFKTYTFRLMTNANGKVTDDVITLFASNDDNDPINPPQPGQPGQNVVNGTFSRQSTFYFTLSVNDVDAASTLSVSLSWASILMALFFFFISLN